MTRLAEISELEVCLLHTYKTKIDLAAKLTERKKHAKQPKKYIVNHEIIALQEERLNLLTAFMNIQEQERTSLLSGQEKSAENIQYFLNKQLLQQQMNIVDELAIKSKASHKKS